MPASSHSDRSAFPVPSLDAPVILEILHGRTQFPQRPVAGSRFLIGSGEACDLRLGGTEMPRLHSVLVIDPDEVALEAVASEPPLLVNNQPMTHASLKDGDILTIGVFQIRAHIQPSVVEMVDLESPATIPLSELSASTLVDYLERDLKEIETYDRRRHLGADALLEAARRQKRAKTSAAPRPHFPLVQPETADVTSPAEHERLGHELDQLAGVLSQLSEEIGHHRTHAAEREATLADVTEQLLETQHRLANQLEVLTQQVGELKLQFQPSGKSRASA